MVRKGKSIMALIKCPECGREISDKAKNCINCGYPIQEYLEERKIKKLKENQVCTINGIDVDFSDITPYFTDSCDNDVILKILQKLDNLENRISLTDEWELIKQIMISHVIPEEYIATSYNEYIQHIETNLQNNSECIIHKTNIYDFSPIKQYIDRHNALDLKCLKLIRRIPELTGDESTYLVSFINKHHVIPFSYPENITELTVEKYVTEIEQYWNQKNHPEEVEQSNPQEPAQNVPHCPNCNSTNIQKISMTSRAISGLTFGILSSSIGKTFKCKNCGYKW